MYCNWFCCLLFLICILLFLGRKTLSYLWIYMKSWMIKYALFGKDYTILKWVLKMSWCNCSQLSGKTLHLYLFFSSTPIQKQNLFGRGYQLNEFERQMDNAKTISLWGRIINNGLNLVIRKHKQMQLVGSCIILKTHSGCRKGII